MKKTRWHSRIAIAVIMVVIMLFSIVAVTAFAADDADVEPTKVYDTQWYKIIYTEPTDTHNAKLEIRIKTNYSDYLEITKADFVELKNHALEVIYNLAFDSIIGGYVDSANSEEEETMAVATTAADSVVLPPDLSHIDISKLEQFIKDQMMSDSVSTQEKKEKFEAVISGDYNSIIAVVVDKYIEEKGYTYEEIETKVNEVFDEVVDHIYADEPEDVRDQIKVEKKEEVTTQVGVIIDEVEDAHAKGESVNFEPSDLKSLDHLIVDGKEIYADGYFSMQAVKELIKELPTLTEIENYDDTEMYLSYSVEVGFIFGDIHFDLTVGLEGDCSEIRTVAGIISEYIDVSRDKDGKIYLTVDVPAKFGEIVLKAIESDQIPDSLKHKVFSLMQKNGNDVDAFVNNLSFSEIIDLLERIDFEDKLDSDIVKKYLGDRFDTLTNEQIVEKVAQYERYYNKAKSLVLRAFDKVPERYMEATLFDIYDGNGVFSADASVSFNVEEVLTKISSEYGPLLAAFIKAEELDISVSGQVTINFRNVNRVTYKLDANTVIGDGFLPVGADINYFANYASHDGKKITAWMEIDGTVHTTAPDKDVVLYPYYGGAVIVSPSENVEATYNPANKYTVSVTPTYNPIGNGGYTVAYEWYKDGQLYSATGSSFEVGAVLDSGEYYCKVTVTENVEGGVYTTTFTTESITVSIAKQNVNVSGMAWSYDKPFVYVPAHTWTVGLINVPEIITVSYTGTVSATDVNVYTAGYTYTYDSDNYELEGDMPEATLVWEIRTVTVETSDDTDVIYTPGTKHTVSATVGYTAITGSYSLTHTWYKNGVVYVPENVTVENGVISFEVSDVADSGEYYCEITITEVIDGTPRVITENSGTINVKIAKRVIDVSGMQWIVDVSGTQSAYDPENPPVYTPGGFWSLDIIGIPEGVTVNQAGTRSTDHAGDFEATYQIIYDVANCEITGIENAAAPVLHWEVKQIEIDITGKFVWTYTEPFDYDGSKKTVELTELHPLINVTFDYSKSKFEAIDAGTYQIFCSYEYDSVNYKIVGGTLIEIFEWEILKKTVDLSGLTWDYTSAYTYAPGTEFEVLLESIPDEIDVNYIVDGFYTNKASVAGNYIAKFEYALKAECNPNNYNLVNAPDAADLELPWTVDKAKIDVSGMQWTDDSSFVYKVDTLWEIALQNVPTDLIKITGGTASAIKAGTYTVSYTYEILDPSNYYIVESELPELTHTWTIAKAKIDVSEMVWNYTKPFTHKLGTVYTVELLNIPQYITVSYGGNYSETDANKYVATYTYVYDSENYEIVGTLPVATLNWEIRTVNLTSSSDVVVTYDSTKKYTVSVNAEYNPIGDGDYTVTYTWYKDNVLFAVTDKSFDVSKVSDSGVYYCVVTVKETVDGDERVVTERTGDIIVTIAKRVINVSNIDWSYTLPFTYDGQKHTIEIVNIPEFITINYADGSVREATDAGKYYATYIMEYDHDNYEIEGTPKASATLEWEIRNVTVKVSPDTDTTYNPVNKHNVSVTVGYSPIGGGDYTVEYKWYKVDGNGDKLLADINGSSFEVINVSDSGEYYCVVTVSETVGGELRTITEKSDNITVKIAPEKIDVSGITWSYTDPFTYNPGTIHTVTLQNVPLHVLVKYGINSVRSATDADTYTATYELEAENGNYEIVGDENLVKVLTWKINPKEIDVSGIEWNYAGPFTYAPNTEFKVELINIPNEIKVNYSGNVAFVAGDNYVATYTLSLIDAKNYVIANANEAPGALDWVVNKAKIDVSRMQWTYTTPFTYEKNTLWTVVLINIPTEINVIYDEDSVFSATNADTYTIACEYYYDSANYDIVGGSLPAENISWEIKKKEIDVSGIKWNYEEGKFTYAPNTEFKVELINVPDGIIVTYNGNVAYVAGNNYKATYTITLVDADNYKLVGAESGTLDWVVNKAKIDVTGMQWTYTKPFTYKDGVVYTVDLIGIPDYLTVNIDKINGTFFATLPGEYTAIYTYSYDEENYEIVGELPVLTLKWEIRTLTVSGSDDVDASYNKDTKHEVSVTVGYNPVVENNEYTTVYKWYKVAADGDKLLADITGASFELTKVADSGVYYCVVTVTEKVSDTDTRELTERSGNIVIKISKCEIDVTDIVWGEKGPFTYNGSEHSVTLDNVPAGVVATLSNYKATNAGTYYATFTLTLEDADNYVIVGTPEADETLTWVINKSEINVSEVVWVYTGPFTYAPGTEYSVSLDKVPAGVTATLSNYKATNAGTYYATFTLTPADSDNYVIVGTPEADETLTWVINKAKINISNVEWVYSAPFTYDGNEKVVEVTNLPSGVTAIYTVNDSFTNKAIKAGTYNAQVVFVYDESNYELEANKPIATELEWVINKASYDMSSVKFEDKTVIYDGKAHGIVISGALPSVDVTVSYSANQTEVGTYEIVATFTNANPNYNDIAPMKATLTIQSAVTPPPATENDFEYKENDKVVVKVESENGIPKDTELAVSNKTDDYKNTDVSSVVPDGKVGEIGAAYDIHFAKDGAETEITGDNFTVRLLIPEVLRSKAELMVIHIADDGTITAMESRRDGDYMEFETTHFSIYAIIALDAEVGNAWLIWLLVAIIIVLSVIIILLIVLRRGKNNDEPTEPAEELPEEPETEPEEEATEEETVEEVVEEEPVVEEPVVEEPVAEEPVVEEPVVEEPVVEEPVVEEPVAEEPVVEEPVVEEPVVEEPVVEEPEVEEPVAEETAPVTPIVPVIIAAKDGEDDAIIVDGQVIYIHYRSSFTSRLIQSDETIQSYYTTIKNYILSFKGVKARTSFNYEAFNKGRTQCVRLNVKGKSLTLNLALDPKEYNANKYHFTDLSDDPKFEKIPMLLKVRSDRALKYALELIDEVMKNLGIAQGEIPTVDYRMPYETNSELAKRGLVKVILPAGVKLDGDLNFREANVSELIGPKNDADTAEAKVIEVEETPVEETPAPVAKAEPKIPEINSDDSIIVDGNVVYIRYRSSFTSRLIQAEEAVQDYYTIIKNHILSYKGVKARASFNYENFNKGRTQLARINIKGKTLTLNLALVPESYSVSKYHFTDVSDDPKFDKLPMLLKVRSARALKYALELIDELMKTMEIKQGAVPTVDYHMPYEPNSELAKRGLVKIILPTGVKLESADVVREANVDSVIEAHEATVEETPVEEVPVEEVTVEEAPVEEAPVEEVPVEEVPVEEATVEEASVEEVPVEEVPVEEAPVEEVPVEEAPVEEVPVEEAPVEEVTVEEVPVEEVPVEEVPVEEVPVEEVPVEEAPVEEAPVEEPVFVDAVHADELVSDDVAEHSIVVVNETHSGKMVEINIGTICENFENGDVVTLAALKAKRLVNAKAGRVKVLAGGVMTKNLTVYADKFSLQAVKMITLAGGVAEQYK